MLSLALRSGSVFADGAWVLWQMDTQPISQPAGWSQKFYTAVDVLPHQAKRDPSGREMATELRLGREYREKTEGKASCQFVRLPDTLDPRGSRR